MPPRVYPVSLRREVNAVPQHLTTSRAQHSISSACWLSSAPHQERSQLDALEGVPVSADEKSSEAVAFFKRAMENMVQQRQLRAALEEAQSALFLEIAPCLA